MDEKSPSFSIDLSDRGERICLLVNTFYALNAIQPAITTHPCYSDLRLEAVQELSILSFFLDKSKLELNHNIDQPLQNSSLFGLDQLLVDGSQVR